MRKYKLAAIFLLCVACSACSHMPQVENQAYILTMGVDKSENGGVELTVQTPKITSSSESESTSANGGASNYYQFSAKGRNFEEALEKLVWAIPRSLNLSHLKMIVFSESIVKDSGFRTLLREIVHTERLFSAARAVVCSGRAKSFITDTKPVMGSRLSTDLTSTFDHYINQGFIPDGTLADFYYATESVYSDPVMIYASDAKAISKADNEIAEDIKATDSEISTRYLGMALFSKGVYRGNMSGEETIYANLLRNELKSFRYDHEGQGLEIFQERAPKIEVNTLTEPVQIEAALSLGISAQEEISELEGLREQLNQALMQTIRRAQAMKSDPFGFADHAAYGFMTIDEWKEFRWLDRFEDANVHLQIDINRIGA